MPAFELVSSERLDELANRKSVDALRKAADASYAFGLEDAFECRGVYEDGLMAGVALGVKLVRPGSLLFSVNFPDYVDDDGLAVFVGTEDEVAYRLASLPDQDEDEEDEDAEAEDDDAHAEDEDEDEDE